MELEESILLTVKKLIGLDESYTVFDPDIIAYINTAFVVLNQLGVGPSKVFSIVDAEDAWSDFGDYEFIEMVKSYIAKKVQLMFDPPTSGALVEAMKNQIAEAEFRLSMYEDE